MNTRLRNRDGSLSVYALGCGYQEKYTAYREGRDYEARAEIDITLRMYLEHGVYNVLQWDRTTGRRTWHQYTKVGEARKRFNQLRKEMQNAA